MMIYAILYSAILSFLTTYFAIKWLLRYLRKIGLVVPDMNKENKPLVPISGGLAVMAGVFVGLMFFIFLQTFSYHDNSFSLFLFGAVTTLLLGTFIGFIDDSVIEKNSGGSSGLKQWQKPLLTIPIAIPLAVINAANTEVTLPILGHIDLGIVYPMIIVPIGVICATNMVNMLAGFNGMETGMGLIYMFSLGLFAYLHNSKFAALIAILGNMEKAALVASIPFIVEFFLKLRAKFNAKSYGYFKEGKIYSYHDKIYSIPHIFSRTGKFTEKQITYF